MNTQELFTRFHEIASNPKGQKDAYLAAGKKVILTTYYTPEEIIHSMGFVPMAAWGADVELKESKQYFPAFICSIMQSILQLGMTGTYDGVSAIVIPSLCDSLKVLGENWKYAVPSIPFIPMTYPQNRKPAYGKEFTKAGYERVIRDLEKATGEMFDEAKLQTSIKVYNEHNKAMREVAAVMAEHPEISAAQRSDVFKSAGFMAKEEHTVLVKELIEALSQQEKGEEKIKVITSGILADSPALLRIFDEIGLQIAMDDVAAESRQYKVDTREEENVLDALAQKFCDMDNDTLLYDAEKNRIQMIVDMAKEKEAKGIVVILTKFCDPEEFDYPLIKKACEAENIPVLLIEVDRQMQNFEQARTLLEGFRDMMENH